MSFCKCRLYPGEDNRKVNMKNRENIYTVEKNQYDVRCLYRE